MRMSALLSTLLVVTTAPAMAIDLPGWVPFIGKKSAPPSMAPTPVQESASTGELRRAENLEAKGDTGGALKVYRGIVKDGPLTASAPKAQFKIGAILERDGKLADAYEAYAAYVAKYPRGGEFDAVIRAQFGIAKVFLDGRKKKVLGVPISPSFEKAEEMFKGIVKSAPFHKLAPLAQFNVGQALEKQGKPTEAIGAYQEVISRYPGDPVADDAHYQAAYVLYRETKDGSYDQSARLRSRESFEDFLNRYPDSEKAAQAKENIKNLSGTDVKGTLEVAKYYDRTKNYKAAVVYYNEVIAIAQGSKESEEARKRIEEIKTIAGPDVLIAGPKKGETGDMALARRRALSRVDIASRPDYNGPLIAYPYPGANRPFMRTSPIGPVVEPALPTGDPLQSLPSDPLLTPSLPPLPPVPGEPLKPEPGEGKKEEPKPEKTEPEKPAENAPKKSDTPAQ
jgi:outer membrane protein assembly factor BamD